MEFRAPMQWHGEGPSLELKLQMAILYELKRASTGTSEPRNLYEQQGYELLSVEQGESASAMIAAQGTASIGFYAWETHLTLGTLKMPEPGVVIPLGANAPTVVHASSDCMRDLIVGAEGLSEARRQQLLAATQFAGVLVPSASTGPSANEFAVTAASMFEGEAVLHTLAENENLTVFGVGPGAIRYEFWLSNTAQVCGGSQVRASGGPAAGPAATLGSDPPADRWQLIVTDPLGRLVGWHPGMPTIMNQIPGAKHALSADGSAQVSINAPNRGTYEVVLRSGAAGGYNLLLEATDPGGTLYSFQYAGEAGGGKDAVPFPTVHADSQGSLVWLSAPPPGIRSITTIPPVCSDLYHVQ